MFNPLHILVVEDVAAPDRHTGRLLKRYGHSITTAGSVLEASALGRGFDCGVFEVRLPDGDGVWLAARLLRANVVARAVFFDDEDPSAMERASEVGVYVLRHHGVTELERVISGRPPRTRSGVRTNGSSSSASALKSSSRGG